MDWKLESEEKPKIKDNPDMCETSTGTSEDVLCLLDNKPIVGKYFNVIDSWYFPNINVGVRPEKWCYIKY